MFSTWPGSGSSLWFTRTVIHMQKDMPSRPLCHQPPVDPKFPAITQSLNGGHFHSVPAPGQWWVPELCGCAGLRWALVCIAVLWGGWLVRGERVKMVVVIIIENIFGRCINYDNILNDIFSNSPTHSHNRQWTEKGAKSRIYCMKHPHPRSYYGRGYVNSRNKVTIYCCWKWNERKSWREMGVRSCEECVEWYISFLFAVLFRTKRTWGQGY